MSHSKIILRVRNLSVAFGNEPILQNLQFEIQEGEQWALLGDAGSGKTVFAHTLAGMQAFSGHVDILPDSQSSSCRVALLEQQHRFKNLANRSEFYYQQRFQSSDSNQTVTVEESLAPWSQADPTTVDYHTFARLSSLLKLNSLMKQPLIQLSSGESKRLQLAKCLLSQPHFLVLDQPFCGLDMGARQTIQQILAELVHGGLRILLITSGNDIPGFITHVALLENGSISLALPKKLYQPKSIQSRKMTKIEDWILALPAPEGMDYQFAIRMIDTQVTYGTKKILQNINWEVRKAEKWSLSGPNGAGKSTLLSLITADNPQSYANEVHLFDRRRGTGESIWEIKRKIGYVSSELHLYFEIGASCQEVVASGFFDTIGLFRGLSTEQLQMTEDCLEAFGLSHRRNTPFGQLPLGEQRFALFARALIKSPSLLILDEPCQGLDPTQTASVRSCVDVYCATRSAALVYVSHYEQDIPSCVEHHLHLVEGRAQAHR